MLEKVRKNIINAIVLCLLILTVVFLVLGVMTNNTNTPLYKYVANKKGDYQVLLKENNFYENSTLPSGKYYASKSIDKYLLKFEYDFKAEKIESIKYRYNIIAQIEGTVSNNTDQENEIWTKDYILIEDKENKITEKEFKVKEDVNINYDTYNDLAREYENNYDISILAKLKVRFNIFYDIKYENKEIEEVEDNIELDIALTDSVSNVEKNYEEVTKKDIFSTNKNNVYYLISAFIGFIAIVLIIVNKNKKTPEEEYKRKIKHILKNYSELIVTVSNEPTIEDYTVLNIKKIEDLIDLAEQNKTNIVHYEAIKDKNNKFYVYVDKFVYIYEI